MNQRCPPIPDLGPLEYRLVCILWEHAPATAGQVLQRHNQQAPKPLKYTTVMTLLTRLVEKRILVADKERQPFLFSPAISQERVLRRRLEEFVDSFFDGKAVDLAVRLVEETPLSQGSIRRLEESLHRHKSASEKGAAEDSGEE